MRSPFTFIGAARRGAAVQATADRAGGADAAPRRVQGVIRILAMTASLFALAAMGTGVCRAAEPTDCNRSCLEGFADQVVAALAARDPSRVPWTKNARYTENNVELRIGDGLWRTASGEGPSGTALRFADVENGQAAYFGIIEERGVPAYLALRVKVENHRVAEAEVIVNRKSEHSPRGIPSQFKHDPAFFKVVPPDERTPRGRMIDLAYGYYSTMQMNDGTMFTQFAPDCTRLENGAMMAGDRHAKRAFNRLSCGEQFKLGFYRWDTRVRERRFPLVDVERGLVLARGFIDHAGVLDKYVLSNGTVRQSPIKAPHSWHFLEVFKMVKGRITRIEAVFVYVPYGMPSPWS